MMMDRRTYRLGRRGEAAEETRRRIVEACFAVHMEQGVAATSMKDVAARAAVSIGTVYHHFPTYDELVTACGRFAAELVPPPSPALLAGLATRKRRVRRAAEAVFAYFDALPVDMVRCDERRVPALRPFVEAEEANRIALVRAALGAGRAGERAVRVAAALLDVAVYRSLRRAGLSRTAAAGEIARLILARRDERRSRLPRRKA